MEQDFYDIKLKNIDNWLKTGFKIYHKTDSFYILKRFKKVYDEGNFQVLETKVTIPLNQENKPTKIYIGWFKNGKK